MDKMPLLTVIFYSFPESCLIFLYGLIVTGRKPKPLPVIIAAVISAGLSYFVRLFPIAFGLHTLIGLLVITFLFIYLLKLQASHAFIAALISLGTMIALENSVLFLMHYFLDLSLPELWNKPLLRTVFPWTSLIIWTLITLFLYKKRIHILN
jgi:hypothetical protein